MTNEPQPASQDGELDPDQQMSIAARNWQEATAAINQLLVHGGLYSHIDLTTPVGRIVALQVDNERLGQFDIYCPACKMVTTFSLGARSVHRPAISTRYKVDAPRPELIALDATCLRVSHYITYVLHRKNDQLVKIGQFPTLADIAFGELREIDRSLDAQDRRELGRALGLFAHDAPLGAFVYLRRVFERMIIRAHDRHVQAGGVPVEDFVGKRMEDRIQAVRNQLPVKVVENRRVFAVLSKGIHELSDEEGRDLFPLVKSVIFQMLGDEERHRAAREQEAETDAALAKVVERYK